MKNFEVCKGMKELLNKALAEIPRIELKISAAIGQQAELDKEAVKAKALEQRDAGKKEEAAKANKELIPQLRTELESAKEKIKVIEGELRKLVGPAVADIKQKYRGPFETAVREFIASCEKAAILERKISAIRDAASAEGSQISPLDLCYCPPFALLLIERSGDPRYSPLNRLKAEIKAEGIVINE